MVQDRVLSQPAWEQGLRMFAWETNSKAIVFTALETARAVLYRATLDISPIQKLPLNDFTWFDHLSLAADGRIAGVASAVHIPPQVICGAPGKLESLRNALPGLPLDEPPRVEGLRWPAKDGTRIYATFTCPPRPTGSDLPPAIIYIHGGPTTQRFARFEVERAYFTSRGFAWVDIDYRGSTGYGRSYRRALYGNWGLVDVEDVFGAAEALEGWGLADPRGLVLYGSSAGGFTLLNSMINHPGGWFAAGLCLYPVTDLLNFPDLDFKLEKHYHEALLGKLPENAEIYRQRSPLFHAAELQDPLALFHGLDDPVVPAEQSRQIAAALQARGSPCVLRLYAGEGHGFRQPETIADMYATMEAFLREHLHLEDQ
jgi:dipeptidyl aminopeptidase/acylaminoacyl peptidase